MSERLVLVADAFGSATSYTVRTTAPIVVQTVSATLSLEPGLTDRVPVLRIYSPGGALIALIQAPTINLL